MNRDGVAMNRENVLVTADELRQRARVQVRNGRFGPARALLREVVTLLTTSLGAVGDEPRQPELAKALADTHGMLGGVEWRTGNLAEAAAAYERGRTIEQDERFGIVDSYNLTNALVLRILLDPSAVPEMRGELQAARETVGKQVSGPRGKQWWAWADYALLCLLSGQTEDATRAYEQFRISGPAPSDHDSVARVLRDLADAITPVDNPRGQAVRHAAASLS
jgi:tetratricopeptide (TPR) repeat protein